MSEAPFVIWNNTARQRPGTPLVVMFHGYGSHEEDLMGLVPTLVPGISYASLRAPQRSGMGFQWFPLSSEIGFSTDAVVASAAPVADWVAERAAEHSHVVLLGFSQGMALATSVARHLPGAVTAVVGLSGFVVPVAQDDAAGFFRDDLLRARPVRMFWGRDPEDPVIPEQLVGITAQWALTHADVTKVQYRGVGHGVSPQELAHVKEYLQHVLG